MDNDNIFYNDRNVNQNINLNINERTAPSDREHFDEDRDRVLEVDRVLGVGEGTANFEARIPVVPFAFEVLKNQIEKTIVFDALIAVDGKVFINARLIKNIPFKTCERAVAPRCSNISRITIGDIRHVTVEIPFSLCINVRNSVRGARVVVLESKVDSVEILNPVRPGGRLVASITEKDCVFVRVKVVGTEELGEEEEC
jgi:hypothetical protein